MERTKHGSESAGVGAGEQELMPALVSAQHWNSHRFLDGRKEHRLHEAGRTHGTAVAGAVVERFRGAGLIARNMKCPADAFPLTVARERTATGQAEKPWRPVLARFFRSE